MRLLADRNGFCSPIYVGDTQGDLEASREAGIPFWWASYGFGKPEAYDRKLDRFADMADCLA